MMLIKGFQTLALAGCLFALPSGATANVPAASARSNATIQQGATTQVRDGWITMKIHSQFIPEEALDDSNINVDTTAGVVTLSGTVPTAAGRARAIAIAKATDGVKSVSDKLKVAPSQGETANAGARAGGAEATAAGKRGGRRVNDGWIKSKIYGDFLDEKALEDSDVDIDVRAGVVTLTGSVPSAAGRTRAVAIAKQTEGVKDVKDSLKVSKE